MKNRKIKISRLLIVLLIPIIFIGLISLIFINFSFFGVKSIHEDAKKYSTRSCLIFYPDSSYSKTMARYICSNTSQETIYDYALVPYGDYYLVDYGNEYSYFVDKKYQKVEINEINDDTKRIISDYLRYYVKLNKPELYNLAFINETSVSNINFNEATYYLKKDQFIVKLVDYDFEIKIPLSDVQDSLKMNFNYPHHIYQKPNCVLKDSKKVCITFSNGPDEYTENIINTLYKYDSIATFYVLGEKLNSDINPLIIKSLNYGNEYGSGLIDEDTYLTNLSNDEIIRQIEGPMKYFKDNFDYQMNTYRPYGMDRDDRVDMLTKYPAVIYNLDSSDWTYSSEDEIYKKVMDNIEDGDIINFFDSFEATNNVIEKIIIELLNNNYELISVTDMLNSIDSDSLVNYIYCATYFD